MGQSKLQYTVCQTTFWIVVFVFNVGLPKCASAQDTRPEFREGYVTVDRGLKLYYRIYGTAKDDEGDSTTPLVFLHGGPGANFMGCGPDLVPLSNSHRFIVYDQRGGGRSDPDPQAATQTIETHVNDLERLRSHLNLKQMILVGHSFGATLAAYYAIKYPQHIDRLLLIAPMEPSRELLDKRINGEQVLSARVAEKFAELEKLPPQDRARARMDIIQSNYYFDPSKMKNRKGHYCDIPRDYFADKRVIGDAVFKSLGSYDLIPDLANFKMPVLIVEGAQSPLPLDGERAWAKALPNSRLWLIDKVGHGYPFVEAPSVFFPGVKRFLDGGWPEGTAKSNSDR